MACDSANRSPLPIHVSLTYRHIQSTNTDIGRIMTKTTDLAQKLRALIDETGYRYNDRIPPERVL